MSFNPPDTRDEIRDTLVFMGIEHDYEKVTTKKGHVFTFALESENFIAIYGPRFMKFNDEKFVSTYDLKRKIMSVYSHLI